MDATHIYNVSTDAMSAAEEISQSISVRSRESVILELFAPTASGFCLLLSRKAWRALTKRFPSLALRGAVAVAPATLAASATGIGAPPALAALTAAEVAALAYFFTSELASVTSLIADFPSSDEATPLLPAASTYDVVSSSPDLVSRFFVPIDKEAVSFAAAYVTHFAGDLSPTAPTKVRMYASLIAGWLCGYVPAPVAVFAAKARSRLSPYAGDNIDHLMTRFAKDVGFVCRYSGLPISRLPLGMKLANIMSATYNIGVASYNTASALCRTLSCPATAVVTQEIIDFILSPSSVEWRLPFASKNAQLTNYDINFVDLQSTAQGVKRATFTTNQLINEADRLVEDN